MEDDLKVFLRSRDVPNGDIMRMERDKSRHFQRQPRSKRQRAPSETVTAQAQRELHPFHSTPTDMKKTHIGQGPDTNSSDDEDENVWNELQPSSDIRDPDFELIDLTSAGPVNQDAPDGDEADTVEWDPEDDLAKTDDDDPVVITLNHNNNDDVIQSAELMGVPTLDLQLPLSSANGLPPVHVQSGGEEAVQTAQEDSRLFSPQAAPSSQLSPLTSAGNPINPSPKHASICRVKVVEDLLAVFMDSSIIELTLKMDFVNEKAIDDAGVSRDVYTAFWEQFLEQCEGETERVPRLRPDFSEAEWQAVGRIWVKGFLDHGIIPVRLSKAFILACIHGIDSVNADVLMTSFQNYLPPIERSAVEKALQGTMEESDEEDLLDLFTRMGSHLLPSKSNMEPAIETMAHKSILQEPKFIVDCFSTPMEHVKLKLPDKESLMSLYESKRATGRRVSQLFETTKMVLSQREQATFNHLQRYAKNADQSKAEKILRFCSGSSVICVEKILVCFNAETGLNRRPVAHTCGATLELPCTYSAYPEFRTEFDNILSSNYLEMDIL
ncbi:uncharacterized protein LOC117809829 isoform X2 [Notolabrus celidotus]|uniref:uncharacterized protein LOC117809829 isoform X2 n=1 Tax=Notolabrus celidotus TaxID=1203425 RepID=UPI0014904380|nr:uncharacterized protein LOC117809829 isoform X2 [Notolabrus celidotus]